MPFISSRWFSSPNSPGKILFKLLPLSLEVITKPFLVLYSIFISWLFGVGTFLMYFTILPLLKYTKSTVSLGYATATRRVFSW